MNPRFVPPAAAVLFACTAALSSAAPQPSPSPPPPVVLPSLPPQVAVPPAAAPYANAAMDVIRGLLGRGAEAVRDLGGSPAGTVTYFKGFDMQLQTGGNAYRTVRVHKGTEIDPRGVSISQGQRVEVTGRAQGDGSVDADRIVIDR